MPKNILLFMTDQQRAEYVGYGDHPKFCVNLRCGVE